MLSFRLPIACLVRDLKYYREPVVRRREIGTVNFVAPLCAKSVAMVCDC